MPGWVILFAVTAGIITVVSLLLATNSIRPGHIWWKRTNDDWTRNKRRF